MSQIPDPTVRPWFSTAMQKLVPTHDTEVSADGGVVVSIGARAAQVVAVASAGV